MSSANSYYDKLKDPRWQRMRLKIMERDGWTCQLCGDKNNTLNVHHFIYGKDPWDTNEKFLITLCESCHEKVSEKKIIEVDIKEKNEPGIGPELFLLIAAALNAGAFEEVRRQGIGANDLDEAKARTLFIAMEEAYQAGDASLEAVLLRLPEEGLRGLLREKASTGEFSNAGRVVKDGVRLIRLRGFEKRRDQMIQRLRLSQETDDPKVLKEIQEEIAHLVGEIELLKCGDSSRTERGAEK